jgi:hypothetical protein
MRHFIALPDQPSWMFLDVSAVSTAAAEWVNERRSNSKEKPKVHQEKRETIHSTDLPPRVAKARLACAASAPVKAKRAHFIVSRTTFPHLRKESTRDTMGFATTVSSAGRIPTVLPTNQRTPLQPWAGSPSSGVVVIQSCFCAALEAVPCPCSFQSHNSTVSLTWQGNSTSNEKLLKKLDDLEKPLTDFRE